MRAGRFSGPNGFQMPFLERYVSFSRILISKILNLVAIIQKSTIFLILLLSTLILSAEFRTFPVLSRPIVSKPITTGSKHAILSLRYFLGIILMYSIAAL